MKYKTILALDVSTSATGYALYSEGTCKLSGVIKKPASKKNNWLIRVQEMAKELENVLSDYNVDVFVIEDSFNSLNVKTLKKLCLAQGLLIGRLIGESELVQVYPKEWQAYYGLARMKRAEIKEKSIGIAQKITKMSNPKSDDEADAIVIGNYYVNRMDKEENE